MKRLKKPIMYVCSDNFDGYMTEDLYKNFILELSTGDFHTHTAVSVSEIDPMSFSAGEFCFHAWDKDPMLVANYIRHLEVV